MQHLYIFAKPFLGIACLVLFLCTGAALAQTTTAGAFGLFGDGSDKDVTITKATTLNRDMYYNNLTIMAGQTLDTGGFRVFVTGKLTLENGARLSRDGNDSVSASGGAALSPGTLGGSGGQSDLFVANSLGGSGAIQHFLCGGAGFATPPDASVGGVGVFRSALQALSGRSLDGAIVNGGAGGGWCGGGGGSGGGVVIVAARTVVSSGMTTIGADGGDGQGGGGGGGVVVVITTIPQPEGLKLSAAGGATMAYAPHREAGYPGFTAWLN